MAHSPDSAGRWIQSSTPPSVEQDGVFEYACTPHAPMGMKGVVVVGELPDSAAEAAEESTTEGDEPEYGEWFENVSNYEETVDRTDADEVTVAVGADGNDGSLAFDQPAVRVDPGTTVVWEWTGDGGFHNVVAEDGRFESELTDEAGFTFERTVTDEGVHKYACAPHEQLGMRGAVVVDESGSADESDSGEMLAIGGSLGMIGALFALFLAGLRGATPDQPSMPRRT